MSSLKDLASLIMVPSLYKDGELHTVKPLADENIIVHPDATDNNDGVDGTTTPSTSSNFTFSRGSNLAATRVDVNGLIEKGRENLLLQSNQFDTTWTLDTGMTLTSGQSGYDGSSDAWLLERNVAFDYLRQDSTNSGVQTYSVYAKAGTFDWVLLRFQDTGGYNGKYFDLSNGVKGSTDGTIIDSNITSLSGGWYRCDVTINATLQKVWIYPVPNDNGVGDAGTGNIYIQDAQLEQGLVATDYIETTTTSVSAGILEDMPRLDYSGSCPSLLLEPQRSNLFTYSEYIEGWSTSNTGVTIEENATTSPEGVNNAAKIKEDANNAAHATRNLTGPTLTSGTDYTFSFFAKKGERSIVALSNTIGASNDANCFFDLENGEVLTNQFNSASIEDYGNGWFRCIVTDTADAADDYDTRIYTATADNQFSHQGVLGSGLYIFGLQLEQGSYPTSYIPTYGTSQTRSDEGAQVTSVSDLIGQTQGTLFAEVDGFNNGEAANRILGISNGTYAERVVMFNSGSTFRFLVASGNSSSVDSVYSTDIDGIHKIAMTYDANEVRMFVDGLKVATDPNVTLPSLLNSVHIGKSEVNGTYTNIYGGSVKQSLVFPTALTDSECIALTTL